MNITAATRATQGTSASRRLRREAKVPAILYGLNQPAAMIELDHNEMFYALQKEKFHSSILTMELDGVEQLVILRAFQMHPYKNLVMHMDFQRIDPNAAVTMRVPLHFFGGENSPAVKIDKALISHLQSSVEVSCLPKDLPEFIDVDLSGMTSQTTLRVGDIALPAGVTAVNPETPVATVANVADDSDSAAAAAPAADAAATATPAA